MPSIQAKLLREQIRLLRPLLTRNSITASRSLQEKLGRLGAAVMSVKVDFTPLAIGDFEAAWAAPEELKRGGRHVVLYLHGGGYVAGSIDYARGFAGILASKLDARVLCAAYRLAPEYPFPAALEDSLAAWDYLLSLGYRAEDISLIGESAGGGLIFSLCLALKMRGSPLPGRLAALSPWTDLTLAGASYKANAEADVSLTEEELRSFAGAYAPPNAEDPLASPLFGDLEGLPPTLIYVGGDEILLDDSRLMALRLQNAAVPCRLTVTEGMWHAYVLYGVPEANEALAEIKEFFEGNTQI